jgi:hypothetical protein
VDRHTSVPREDADVTGTGPGAEVKRPEITVAELTTLGDVVIVLGNDGRSGMAYIRGNEAPMDITVDYGERDDPPLSIRRVTVKVGWSAAVWRKSEQADRDVVGAGQDWWRQSRGLDPSAGGSPDGDAVDVSKP